MTIVDGHAGDALPVRRMPAEWTPHARTWMAFPPPNQTFGDRGSPLLAAARRSWAEVANTLARHEPVTMVTGIGDAEHARDLLDRRVDVAELPLDDAWMRDIGPTFVRDPGSATGVRAVNWMFNGWGAQSWAAWERDAEIARQVAKLSGTPVDDSALTMEGGGFHVDGEGTVLLTETVQLDPARNPGWTAARVEAEVHARLGTSTAIWLPRGLAADYGDYGTRGHVDLVATFLRPGVVAVHTQADPAHPDYPLSREVTEILRASTDARGRRLQVVAVPAPRVLEVDGEFVDYSYLNHYVGNGVVLLGGFDDPNDAVAADILGRAYGRTVELVDARTIFACGGGVHCITQQQPAPPVTGKTANP